VEAETLRKEAGSGFHIPDSKPVPLETTKVLRKCNRIES